jgi:hypothetical protein
MQHALRVVFFDEDRLAEHEAHRTRDADRAERLVRKVQ